MKFSATVSPQRCRFPLISLSVRTLDASLQAMFWREGVFALGGAIEMRMEDLAVWAPQAGKLRRSSDRSVFICGFALLPAALTSWWPSQLFGSFWV
jgi:hypothetical protein